MPATTDLADDRSRARAVDGGPVLRMADGRVVPLLVDRWHAQPGGDEQAVLDLAVGPVIDIGCGPGRLVAELAGRGVVVMGIDVSSDAVDAARRSGAMVLERSVFARVPNEGRWATALLFDGNIGIGGDPVALLRRLAAILRPGGVVLAELDPPGAGTVTTTARVERGADTGPWFPWARVAIEGIDDIAAAAGFDRTWVFAGGGRWFVRLSS